MAMPHDPMLLVCAAWILGNTESFSVSLKEHVTEETRKTQVGAGRGLCGGRDFPASQDPCSRRELTPADLPPLACTFTLIHTQEEINWLIINK